MSVVLGIVIGIFVLLLLIGIRDWFNVFRWSWFENGKLFTVLFIILMLLFFSPSFVKDFAPEYYGLSIWILILYSLGLIAFRFMRRNNKNDVEG